VEGEVGVGRGCVGGSVGGVSDSIDVVQVVLEYNGDSSVVDGKPLAIVSLVKMDAQVSNVVAK
jgi:hypothetical protein